MRTLSSSKRATALVGGGSITSLTLAAMFTAAWRSIPGYGQDRRLREVWRWSRDRGRSTLLLGMNSVASWTIVASAGIIQMDSLDNPEEANASPSPTTKNSGSIRRR
jgi:hypothetical protein